MTCQNVISLVVAAAIHGLEAYVPEASIYLAAARFLNRERIESLDYFGRVMSAVKVSSVTASISARLFLP